MAFCGQCGSALEPADQFCGECGASASSTTSPSAASPPAAASAAATTQMASVPPANSTPASSTPPSNQRFALWGAVGAAIVLLLVGVYLVTRDSDDTAQDAAVTTLPGVVSDSSTTTVPTTPVSTTAVPTTVTAATLAPAPTTSAAPATTTATTLPPATLAPATTLPPALTVPTAPAGWNPATIPPQAYPRLSEENLVGVPSPLIVDLTAPVPDGLYRTSYVSHDGVNLILDLYRYESCEILGIGPCLEGPYGPSDVGTYATPTATVTVPLDATTTVVISGWDCGEVIGQGNGTDLAAMYAAFAADYDLAFSAALAAGTDPYDLMEMVNANPVGRFGPPPAECDYGFSLVWQYETAPPVHVQYAFDWDTGGAVDPASLLIPSAIEVNGNSTTVYIYAGFFS